MIDDVEKWNDLISIHALRGEGDGRREQWQILRSTFQSTPSVGRATSTALSCILFTSVFQSTPSVGRATHAERKI